MGGEAPFRALIEYSIGGGWGDEEPRPDAIAVRIIRGTDFSNITSGAYEQVPRRFESREKAERRLLRAGDIVLEISGGSSTSNQSTGRTLFITQEILERLKDPAIPASFCRLVRVRTDVVEPRYAYYALQEMYRSGRAGLYEHHSTGISNFQFEYFLDREVVRLPSLPEQRAIAHILGTLDDKIELNRRMSETLEAMARALFKAWFVDFEPVRAKRRGTLQRAPTRWPRHILDLFPDRLVPSELGEIPEGWGVGQVRDIGSVICGRTPSTNVQGYYGDNIPFVTIPDMHHKVFVIDTQKKLSHLGAASQPTKLLPTGSICVSCIATPGLVAMTSAPAQTNQQINSVVPAEKDQTYFWFWTLRQLGDQIRQHGSGGSVVTNLSTGRFKELSVLFPPKALRALYHESSAPFFSHILRCERESRTLAAIRDTLLPMLISGELRVKDAERFLKERGL